MSEFLRPAERERRGGRRHWRPQSLRRHHPVLCGAVGQAEQSRGDAALLARIGGGVRSERCELQAVRTPRVDDGRHKGKLFDAIEVEPPCDQMASLAQQESCRVLVG